VRRGRLAITAALACGIPVLTGGSARAGTTDPGLLQASDLPGEVEQIDVPGVETTVNQFVVDADACTQTLRVEEAASGIQRVQFSQPVTGTTILAEAIITYPNAKTAKLAFKQHAATARKAEKRVRAEA
jgi:hypothetical protein